MTALSMLGAAGVWAAVPLTGFLIFGFGQHESSTQRWPLVTVVAVMAVAGLAVWSPILLGAAIAGVFRADLLGLLGWAVSAVAVVQLFAQRKALAAAIQPLSSWDWVLAGGMLLVAALYLGFPGESIYGGRDEGVYASHAVYLAHHGRLEVPYPWPPEAQAIFSDSWVGFPGFYKTAHAMTVQFGHLLPVWMAQAFATLGEHGLFGVNAVFAWLSVAVFYGLCRMAMAHPLAVTATLFFALNPSQLWMARMTLSEILTQLFTWAGLFLLLQAIKIDRPPLARWAGVFLGLSGFVRFDSFFLIPVLLLSHLALRIVEEPAGRSTPVWLALYQTALPVFALALAYFAIFSGPYLMDRPYLHKLEAGCIGPALALVALRPGLIRHIRPVVTSTAFCVATGLGLLALAAYAYWIRPIPTSPPRLQYWWPGYYWDNAKGDHSIESLPNLARYLSPVVVWAAVAGWFATFWVIVRERRDEYLLAALVIILGFSFVYLYDHSNTPDHFWVIRRYIPVVIPGFVLCAAFAARWLASRLPRAWVVPSSVVALLFLAIFTVRADSLILTFAEDRRYYAQVEALAQKLPRDQVILVRGFTEWVTPLYIAFDRRVIPLNLDRGSKGRGALQTWIARQASAHTPVYLLIENAAELNNLNIRQVGEVVISRVFTEPTVDPLPKKIVTKQRRVRLYEVTGLKAG